jgi:hypothetical protein
LGQTFCVRDAILQSPLPWNKRAIALLEAGDADAAREAAECVGDEADDIDACEAFILIGFA